MFIYTPNLLILEKTMLINNQKIKFYMNIENRVIRTLCLRPCDGLKVKISEHLDSHNLKPNFIRQVKMAA